MIIIDIEIKDRNRLKEFLHYLYSKLEDLMFAIVQKIPEKYVPQFLMEWLDRYTTKRLNELKQQTIHQTWRNLYLEKAVNDISDRQQSKKETPSED